MVVTRRRGIFINAGYRSFSPDGIRYSGRNGVPVRVLSGCYRRGSAECGVCPLAIVRTMFSNLANAELSEVLTTYGDICLA